MAVISISGFHENTPTELAAAIDAIKKLGCDRIVFDMRNNPGGLLTSVRDSLDLILPEGTIVRMVDSEGNWTSLSSDASCVSMPMVVIVNGNTASAAEVLASCLKEQHPNTTLVGKTTCGKGVIQTTYILKDGSAFKLTTGKYLTGGRRDIHESGIEPDIVIEDADGQLETALEYIRGKLEEAAAEETEPESGEKVMPDEAEPESGEKVMPEETERKLHG